MDKSKIRYICPNGLSIEATQRVLAKVKDLADRLEKSYKGIKFYSEVLVNEGEQCISVGATEKQMLEIPNMVYRLTRLHAFIRFLETAMKELKKYQEKCFYFSFVDYRKLQGLPYLEEPQKLLPMTEEEYFETLSPDEICRYLALQARAAAIGKFIHPKGVFSKQRNHLLDSLAEPISVTGQGANMMVQTIEPSIPEEDVESMLFRLQDMHREVQKKINAVKFACKTAILEDEKRKSEEYLKAKDKYKAESDEMDKKYEEYKSQIIFESTSYGVAIPPMFVEVYNWIKKM